MLKSRYRLTVAYDGSSFFGWQKQPHPGQISIQESLETALHTLFQSSIRVVGSGRTDRGVHARAQVAHFDLPRECSADSNLPYRLGELTPESISIVDIQKAPPKFHAQVWAQKKTYEYLIFNQKRACPFHRHFSTHISQPLNLEYLAEASQYLLGSQDFKSFQSSGTPTNTTERKILEAHWSYRSDGLISFKTTGNGFLKQMVRNIVGSLLELYREKQAPEKIKEIIEACDRRAAGPTAPAQGLFLDRVYYGTEVDNGCLSL